MAVFAKADGAAAIAAELDRHAAGLQNACADLLGQLLQMYMTGSGFAPCVLDADARTMNVVIVITDGLGKSTHTRHFRFQQNVCVVFELSHNVLPFDSIIISFIIHERYILFTNILHHLFKKKSTADSYKMLRPFLCIFFKN